MQSGCRSYKVTDFPGHKYDRSDEHWKSLPLTKHMFNAVTGCFMSFDVMVFWLSQRILESTNTLGMDILDHPTMKNNVAEGNITSHSSM